MKRDMDLVNAILIAAQNHPGEYLTWEHLLSGLPKKYTEAEEKVAPIIAHLRLMQEAGFVTTNLDVNTPSLALKRLRLTWKGHDEATRLANLKGVKPTPS